MRKRTSRSPVTQRLETVKRLRTLLQAFRNDLGRRLARRSAATSGETFSYQPVFDQFDTERITVERRLADAEDAYVRAQAGVQACREPRRVATSALYDRQRSIRKILAGLPASRLEGAGISGAMPQSAPTLAHQVGLTVKLLRDLTIAESEPIPGFIIKGDLLAGKLETALGTLEACRADLEERLHVADVTRCRANLAMAEYDRVGPSVARCLAGFCQLAGMEGTPGVNPRAMKGAPAGLTG